MGAAAFQGGLASAALGLIIHFGLAFGFTALFVAAYLRLGRVRKHATPAGLVYGALVWAFMNLVALPHSNVAQVSLSVLDVVHGLIGHALFVGTPVALAARRFIGK